MIDAFEEESPDDILKRSLVPILKILWLILQEAEINEIVVTWLRGCFKIQLALIDLLAHVMDGCKEETRDSCLIKI